MPPAETIQGSLEELIFFPMEIVTPNQMQISEKTKMFKQKNSSFL